MCAWSLAHAHARTGDSIAIANYMGGTDEFDQSIASFAVSYAEQNDEDYAIFKKLIKSGELPCARYKVTVVAGPVAVIFDANGLAVRSVYSLAQIILVENGHFENCLH